MCETGNQTIYWECAKALKSQGYRTNQEMREQLRKNEGCVAKLDKEKAPVLN